MRYSINEYGQFSSKKVLFLHSNTPDYLSDSLFHGLRTLLGKNCVDVPRYDSMYITISEDTKMKLRGYGFTLYGLLKDHPELSDKRFFWQKELNNYDLIVIANIWLQWSVYNEIVNLVNESKIVILDGADTPALFPYANMRYWLKKYPWVYFLLKSRCKYYFKREMIGYGCQYGLDKFLPHLLRRFFKLSNKVKPISFSIPEEKIWIGNLNDKNQDFPSHIVDSDLAVALSKKSENYIFRKEGDYYSDLRRSRFGITTKRGGWDCIRHYELAANGCVICFKNLNTKFLV